MLEPIINDYIPEGYVEIAEGDYTKIIQLDTAYELELVDSLANIGWVLISIVPTGDKYTYWFQSKRKIYFNNNK